MLEVTFVPGSSAGFSRAGLVPKQSRRQLAAHPGVLGSACVLPALGSSGVTALPAPLGEPSGARYLWECQVGACWAGLWWWGRLQIPPLKL